MHAFCDSRWRITIELCANAITAYLHYIFQFVFASRTGCPKNLRKHRPTLHISCYLLLFAVCEFTVYIIV